MKILALDTSSGACSAAVRAAGKTAARRFEVMQRGHSECLMPMIRDVLGEAGLAMSDLDLIAVTVGPGAFTGLRIGLAAARGLALAAGKPCFGVTTTEAVAAGVRDETPVLVAIDSKRADLFVQIFLSQPRRPAAPAAAVCPDSLAGFIDAVMPGLRRLEVVGNATAAALQALAAASFAASPSGASPHPNAALVAALAEDRWRPGVDAALPAPLYLRAPDAVAPVNGGRLRP